MAEKKTSIGGQALLEGIMMRGPKITAMAVRNPEGEIVVEEAPTFVSKRSAVLKKPFIRGIFNMYDNLRVGYKYLMRSAEIAGIDEEPKDKEKAEKESKLFNYVLMPLAVVLAMVLAVGLFMYLPTQLYKWISMAAPALEGNRFLQSTFEGVFRIIIFVGYVVAVSFMKDIRRTFMYHGAEHKSIACFESGEELTPENAAKHKRFHPRCGTSFMFFMILLGIFAGIIIKSLIPGLDTWLYTLIRLLILPVVMGVGYEIIMLAGKHDNIVTRVISAPGLWVQRITTKEPTLDMLEVAIVSIKCALRDDFPEFREFFDTRAWEKKSACDGCECDDCDECELMPESDENDAS